ncbi:MAG: hypothetical protein ABSE17_02735 [Candidatus Levyibacteriota bacterium]
MKEKGILARIIGSGRQNPQEQEKQLHEARQLSARVTQLGANANSAQEKLGPEFEAFMVSSLSSPEERDEMRSIILDGLELEGIYCSLALIDLGIKEGLPPSTVLHLVDGLRERAIPSPKSLDRT